jgi:membrane-associated protease RseP (regulator of RpoE activity)
MGRICVIVAFALSGCALTPGGEGGNGYAKFFSPEPGATPQAVAAMRAAPTTGSPQVVSVAKWDSNTAGSFARQGYVLIGSSSFTSGHPEPDQDAIRLGTQIGADLVVILSPEYKGTVSSNVPITVPTTSTSYTNASATAYGAGGPAMAYGSSTTTTYGTSTTYVPVTVQRSAYAAGYFIKKHYVFGAMFRDLNDAERQQYQTNRGAYVSTVIDGSPAYNADILPGDVILRVNGQTINGQAGLIDSINAVRGQTVEVTVVRQGQTVSKRVSILD